MAYIYIYDAVNTTNIRDKQLRIEMTVKKEMVEKDQIKLEWIKKDYKLADVMTKKGASCELLIEVLKNSKIPWFHNLKM